MNMVLNMDVAGYRTILECTNCMKKLLPLSFAHVNLKIKNAVFEDSRDKLKQTMSEPLVESGKTHGK